MDELADELNSLSLKRRREDDTERPREDDADKSP